MKTPKKNVTYEGYLKIPQLLSLQQPLSDHPDEWQFVVVHQAYELWFKLILIELRHAIGHLTHGELWSAVKSMERINAVLRTMIPQTHILQSMNSWDFGQFRSYLGKASGFDSKQFREIEHLSGLKKHAHAPMPIKAKTPTGPTLKDAWFKHLSALADDPVKAIGQLYRQPDRHPDQYALLHALEDYEELMALWRNEHARLAERMIGVPTHGTGGSGGVAYLDMAARQRFFQEINQARANLMLGDHYPTH